MKNKKGITLIALILTIIILLILTGVSFNAIFGENGILNQAKKASQNYNDESVKEEIMLAWLASMTKYYEDLENNKTTQSNFYDYFTKEKLNKNLQNNGKVRKIDYNETTGEFTLTYTSNSINKTYELKIQKDGSTEIINNNVDLDQYDYAEVNKDIYAFYYEEEKILAFNNKNEGIEGKSPTDSWNVNETAEEELMQTMIMRPPAYGDNSKLLEYEYDHYIEITWPCNFWYYTSRSIEEIIFLGEIYPKNTDGWFADMGELDTIQNIEYLKMNYCTSMEGMFFYCKTLKNLDLTSFNTSKVTNMKNLFRECYNLKSLSLVNFDTSNVEDMSGMFFGCQSLTNLDISSFKTSNLKKIDVMFKACNNLINLNLSNFDVSNVESFVGVFSNCKKLELLNIDSWNPKKANKFVGMFDRCENLTSLNLENFNLSENAENMKGMFFWCIKLENLNLENFNTQNVTNMDYLFYNCSRLNNINIGNNFTFAQQRDNIFDYCPDTGIVTYPNGTTKLYSEI